MDKQHEIYMANARILRWGANTTFIPLLGFRVGGNTNFGVYIGGNAKFSVFRYQHVVSPARIFALADPKQSPNASSLASQWNIGLNVF